MGAQVRSAARQGLRSDDARAAAVGAAAGFVWIGALRVWMAMLVGPESTVTWRTGPFVLLPGTLIGAAHGVAAGRRAHGDRVPPAARWSLVLFAAPLLLPGAVRKLVTTGIGSGALVPPAVMAASGAALRPAIAEAHPRARRIGASVGALAIAAGTIGGAATKSLGRPARGALVGLLGTGLMVLAGAAAPLAYGRPGARVTPR